LLLSSDWDKDFSPSVAFAMVQDYTTG
jgi:hypothetical protein